MKPLLLVIMGACASATPRAESLHGEKVPAAPAPGEGTHDDEQGIEPGTTRARSTAVVVPVLLDCMSTGAPIPVEGTNTTGVDGDMCAALGAASNKVTWPTSVPSSAGYSVFATLLRLDTQDAGTACSVSLELRTHGKTIAKANGTGTAPPVPPGRPEEETAEANCVATVVHSLLPRTVASLKTHMAAPSATPQAP